MNNTNQIQIRTILFKPEFVNKYYMRNPGEKKFTKISMDKWFSLYKKSNVECLPPLTAE